MRTMSNVNYPYPLLLPLFPQNINRAEYQQLTDHKAGWRGVSTPSDAPYWQVIPIYIYAYCPFCGRCYQEPADTYKLSVGWSQNIADLRHALYVYDEIVPLKSPCAHFIGVQRFVNLHTLIPSEFEYSRMLMAKFLI